MSKESLIGRLLDQAESLLPHQLIPQEWHQAVKTLFKEMLSKCDLVTREEFDLQNEMLHNTRQQLIQLEQQVKILEQQKI